MATVDYPPTYTTDSVTSKDGTTIGYRQMGRGPGLILMHGGMQAAQNFMRLATFLADDFTVYVPDRRGRGLSGSYDHHYTLQNAVDDLDALLAKTGAHNVFALSSGAIIALQTALVRPASGIDKLAIFEPPLSIDGSSAMEWLSRFDQEIAQGKIGAAMVTVMKGTKDTSFFGTLPRFITVPLVTMAVKAEAKEPEGGDVPIGEIVPTMHSDGQIIIDTADTIERYQDVSADVFLLGGSKSPAYLKLALDRLEAVLPHVRRVELKGADHVAADDSGQPERVAQELRRFFAEVPVGVV
ncbi:MAG: alpha/beta hydrolase [Chloroflexota bacterium]